MDIKQSIVEKGEKIKNNLEQRFAFAAQTLREPESLFREINERENEISEYYDTERHTLPDDEVENRDWAISKYYKAKDKIQKLAQEDREFIEKELRALHEETGTLSTTNNSIRTILGIVYWSTNMTVSNAVEFGSTAYLWAKSLEIDDPDTRSFALGAMALYTFYSSQWFVPTVAGVTRLLVHTIPEEMIKRPSIYRR